MTSMKTLNSVYTEWYPVVKFLQVYHRGWFFNVPIHFASSASLNRFPMKASWRTRYCTSLSTRCWWRFGSSDASASIRSICPSNHTHVSMLVTKNPSWINTNQNFCKATLIKLSCKLTSLATSTLLLPLDRIRSWPTLCPEKVATLNNS